MPNYFDQFDAKPKRSSGGGGANFFDRYDDQPGAFSNVQAGAVAGTAPQRARAIRQGLPAGTITGPEDTTFGEDIAGAFSRGRQGLKSLAPNVVATSEIDLIRAAAAAPSASAIARGLVLPRDARDLTTPEVARVDAAVGMLADEQAKAEAVRAARPPSLAVEGFQNTEGWGDAFSAFASNPLEISGTIGLESGVQMALALLASAVSRNPGIAATAIGGTSGAMEYGSGVLDYFAQQGIRPEEIPAQPAEALARATDYAKTRATVIGMIDAFSAGLVSKLGIPASMIKGRLARELANVGVATAGEAFTGGGSELAAAAATGAEANPADVLAEAFGSGATAPAQVARPIVDRALAARAETPVDPVALEAVARAMAPPPGGNTIVEAAPAPPPDLAAAFTDLVEPPVPQPTAQEPAGATIDTQPAASVPHAAPEAAPASPAQAPAPSSPIPPVLQALADQLYGQVTPPAVAPATAPPPTAELPTEPAAPGAAQGAWTPPAQAPVPDRLSELRARGAERTPEETTEYVSALEQDRTAGKVGGRVMPRVRNMTAHAEASDAGTLLPVQAYLDGDDFKRINDELDHDAGDAAIASIGDALAAEFGEGNVFHRGGDEFFVQGATDAEISAGMERARERLKGATLTVTLPDGTVRSRTGIGFSYGTGATTKEAEGVAKSDKAARKAAGLRTGARDRATDDGAGAPRNDERPDAGAAQEDARRPEAPAPRVTPPAAQPATVTTIGAAARAPVTREPQAPPPASPAVDEPEPAEPEPKPTTTLKNETRDQDRERRGADPILRETFVGNEEALDKARAAVEANPSLPSEIVRRVNEGDTRVSLDEEAALLVEDVNVRRGRDAAAERAADESLSEQERAAARAEWTAAEERLNELDQAISAVGTEAGRALQFRKKTLALDYSVDALRRKERASRGRGLTPEEDAQIVKQARTIAAKADAAAKAEQALAEEETKTGAKVTYDNLAAEIAKLLRGDTPKRRPTLERLKAAAEESMEALRKKRGQFNSGIDATQFYHLARIGVYVFAEGAVKFKDWAAKMKARLGDLYDSARDTLPAVFEAAKVQSDSVAKTTPEATLATIDPESITHRDVYNLARAHVLAGVKGEDAVMKATHKDLATIDEEITERDVRQLFSDYGKVAFPSKAEDRVALREIRALVQLQESIDRLEEGLPALKSGLQRDKATAEIRARRRRLNDLLKQQEAKSGADPTKLATYQEARANNLRNQIEDLQRMIATGERKTRPPAPAPNREVEILTKQRNALRDQLKAIDKGPPKSEEERYQGQRSKALQRELDAVRKRIAAGDYAKAPPRAPRALTAQNERAQHELRQAKADFARRQFEIEMGNRPLLKRIFGRSVEGINLARAIMTSFDLSAVLRQGGFISLGHPLRAMKLAPSMLKAIFSEQYASKVESDLLSRPNAKNGYYRRGNLDLPDPHSHNLAKVEEAYMSRLLEKVDWRDSSRSKARRALSVALSPVRGSARAFTTFLNQLRADSFDAMVSSLPMTKNPTDAELKAIGNYINVATGRGKIGLSDKAAVGLNTVFFAPRLVASRFNLLAGQPLYGGSMNTRAMIVDEYARFALGVGAVMGLGALAHGEDDDDKPFVQTDPRHTDFLRMRFGNTYVDPMTGLAQASVLLSRLFGGEKITAKGSLQPLRAGGLPRYEPTIGGGEYDKMDKKTGGPAYGSDTVDQIMFRFLRTKLAPVPGAAWNMIAGEDVVKEPVTAGGQAASLVTPLSLRNVYDVMKENGAGGGSALLALEMLGMGLQYRDPLRGSAAQSPGARVRENLRTSAPEAP